MDAINELPATNKAILKTFENVLPKLSTLEKERLLAFGEGMAFKAELQEKKQAV